MTKFFKKYNKIMMLLVVVATLGLARVALAANACPDKYIVLQVPIPGLGWCVKGFPEYLQAIYNLFVGISGILAVIMMMYGGFQWLIAGGNPTKISGAKATILSAMAGLSLLLASYAILNLINPRLTNLSLDIKSIDKSVWVGGADTFCTDGLKFTPKNNEKKPNCGIIYSMSAGGNCYGVGCKEDEVCQNRSSSGVVASCASNVVLENRLGYGYEDKSTGSQNSIWTIADEGYVSASRTSTTLYCGKLYYRLLGSGDGEKLVGSFCDNEKSCVIKLDNGVVFSKKASETSAYKFEEVGFISTRNCY